MEIERDNIEKMNRFKKQPPHPSYIAGLIDGDGCIFIRKIKDGYQSGITITQCRTNILQIIRYHFGGSITSSINRNNKIENIMDENNEYYYKYNKRNEYNLLIRSNEYQVILEYIKDYIIIKQEQIECLYEINKIVNVPNKIVEKEELYERCSNNNIKTNVKSENFIKINIEYIQGLFDAEGCLFIKNDYKKFEISISQKNHPLLLYEIQKFLGFGKVIQDIEFKIYKKSDCLQFIQLIKSGVIVKYNQMYAFEKFLNTEDKNIKEQMYKICNEEKHKIEIFNELNQNDKGKEGYLETIRLRELKEKICNQIKLKQVYKEKSENMKGENNHNYGKKFSEDTKKKMSTSIRNSKNGISDEIIMKVRNMIKNGDKIIEIQEICNLPRHTISRIKNENIICRNEEKRERKPMTQEEIGISKRKIRLDEIMIVIEKTILGDKPSTILNFLIQRRNTKNISNELTIDIIKNIKRNIQQNKLPFYDFELDFEKYNYYSKLVENYNNAKNNINIIS